MPLNPKDLNSACSSCQPPASRSAYNHPYFSMNKHKSLGGGRRVSGWIVESVSSRNQSTKKGMLALHHRTDVCLMREDEIVWGRLDKLVMSKYN
jgi:hypothetical protein